MNKKFLLVLAIIFMVMGVMGTDAYSWNRQNVKRQKEETAGWITSSVWTDWNESGGIQEVSKRKKTEQNMKRR
jgi:hypothetical protein